MTYNVFGGTLSLTQSINLGHNFDRSSYIKTKNKPKITLKLFLKT